MKTKIVATAGGVNLNVKMFKFAGGEYQVSTMPLTRPLPSNKVQITAFLLDGDIMPLALVIDAIRRQIKPEEVSLHLPYLPYARQDRVMNTGESLAIKVFADAVNALGVDCVFVDDAHSDVGVALINNCVNIPSYVAIKDGELEGEFPSGKSYSLVAPDAGALKKTLSAAKALGITDVIRADKVRDVTTGLIVATEVHGDVEGKDVLIMDDICDGGRTFIELAKVLRAKGAKSVRLHVTHGIFSQGMEVFDGLIDHVSYVYNYREMFK